MSLLYNNQAWIRRSTKIFLIEIQEKDQLSYLRMPLFTNIFLRKRLKDIYQRPLFIIQCIPIFCWSHIILLKKYPVKVGHILKTALHSDIDNIFLCVLQESYGSI